MRGIIFLIMLLFTSYLAADTTRTSTESTYATGTSGQIAHIYTDETPDNDPETDDDETTEFLDAYGNPIEEYQYRDKFDKQSKDLQNRASTPFGFSGKKFGEEKFKTIKFGENKESEKNSETEDSESKDKAENSNLETEIKPPTDAKRKVLVS